MDDLIEALQIMKKYGNPSYTTICTHDEMYVTHEINPDNVSEEDINRLEDLGFHVTDEFGSDCKQFKSYKFGSA